MIEPEFSRPVKVNEMGKAGLEFSTEATAEECAALAQRLDISKLNNLSAQIRVRHWRKGGAHLTAQIKGSMMRRCVVSLEEFEQAFEDEVDVQYADPRDKILLPDIEDGEMILDSAGDDPAEVLENNQFDAGEAIAQHLVLTLDPYPRKPEAEFEDISSKREETSPFDVLKTLQTDADLGSEDS